MQTVNTRDLQVGQRIRLALGFDGGVVYEGAIVAKGATRDGSYVPDAIVFTLADGTPKYALGEIPGEVLVTK